MKVCHTKDTTCGTNVVWMNDFVSRKLILVWQLSQCLSVFILPGWLRVTSLENSSWRSVVPSGKLPHLWYNKYFTLILGILYNYIKLILTLYRVTVCYSYITLHCICNELHYKMICFKLHNMYICLIWHYIINIIWK